MQSASGLEVSLLDPVGLGVRVCGVRRLPGNPSFLRTGQLREGSGRHLQLWRLDYWVASMKWDVPEDNRDDERAKHRSTDTCPPKPRRPPDWQGQAKTFVARGIQQNALAHTGRQSGRGRLHSVRIGECLAFFLQGTPINGAVLLAQDDDSRLAGVF